jgi:hypothetical protein
MEQAIIKITIEANQKCSIPSLDSLKRMVMITPETKIMISTRTIPIILKEVQSEELLYHKSN